MTQVNLPPEAFDIEHLVEEFQWKGWALQQYKNRPPLSFPVVLKKKSLWHSRLTYITRVMFVGTKRDKEGYQKYLAEILISVLFEKLSPEEAKEKLLTFEGGGNTDTFLPHITTTTEEAVRLLSYDFIFGLGLP